MKTIQLTKGLVAKVDDKWYEILTKHYTWSASLVGARYYAVTATFGKEAMHSIIMETVPHEPSEEVHHKNGDTLDNQEENLEWVTRSQNMIYTPLRKDSTTGAKGVYYRPEASSIKPWVAEVKRNSKRVFLKSFSTKEEAINARKEFTDKWDSTPQQIQASGEETSQTQSPVSPPPESPLSHKPDAPR